MRNNNQALLIDAENIGWHLAPLLLDAALQFGPCTVRRMYGNFSGPILQDWQTFAIEHGFALRHTPIVAGLKNSSDIALVIDAMDLLHHGQVGGFCIASSDCDFTALAIRIREAGLSVHVLGERKASSALRGAGTKFIEVAVGSPEISDPTHKSKPLAAPKARPQPKAVLDPKTPTNCKTAKTKLTAAQIEEASALISLAIKNRDPDGNWISMSDLGNELHSLDANFKPAKFASSTLTKLVDVLTIFERSHTAGGVAQIRLRRN